MKVWDMEDVVQGDDGKDKQPRSVARNAWLAIIAGALIASVTHRVLSAGRLEHTSLVFIGIPAIIGIAVIMMPRSTSVTGVILKAITLALVLSGIFLGEGFVCILFAAPLFYLVGILIGLAADYWGGGRNRENRLNGSVLVVLLILGPSSLEGVIPGFEFGRNAMVTRTNKHVPPDTHVLPDPHVLPGNTNKNTNPSPWDQGEGQGRGFEPFAHHHAAPAAAGVTR